MCVNRHGYLPVCRSVQSVSLGFSSARAEELCCQSFGFDKLIGFHRVCIFHIYLVEIVASAAELLMSVLS